MPGGRPPKSRAKRLSAELRSGLIPRHSVERAAQLGDEDAIAVVGVKVVEPLLKSLELLLKAMTPERARQRRREIIEEGAKYINPWELNWMDKHTQFRRSVLRLILLHQYEVIDDVRREGYDNLIKRGL